MKEDTIDTLLATLHAECCRKDLRDLLIEVWTANEHTAQGGSAPYYRLASDSRAITQFLNGRWVATALQSAALEQLRGDTGLVAPLSSLYRRMHNVDAAVEVFRLLEEDSLTCHMLLPYRRMLQPDYPADPLPTGGEAQRDELPSQLNQHLAAVQIIRGLWSSCFKSGLAKAAATAGSVEIAALSRLVNMLEVLLRRTLKFAESSDIRRASLMRFYSDQLVLGECSNLARAVQNARSAEQVCSLIVEHKCLVDTLEVLVAKLDENE